MPSLKPMFVTIAMLAVATTTGCSGDDAAAPRSPQASSTADHHDHGSDSGDSGGGELTVGLGGPVSLIAASGGAEVTYAVTAVETAKVDDEGDKAAENDVLVVAQVTVQVFAGNHVSGTENDDYRLCFVAEDGTEYQPSSQVVAPELTGTLAADEIADGNVVFDVPSDVAQSGRVRLTAAANGGEQIIFWDRQ